ncbi:MAG: ribonuclease PH [Bdellovibrionales bacterium]|nr:ribonuclease PH [Bdellovibrionales bacterium]
MSTRHDKRANDQLRPVTIETSVNRYAEGSALIKYGHTHVMCTASIEPSIPKWLQGQGKGWITAEYGMLPRSTHDRMNREKTAASGRSQEISRLIARSLRSSTNLFSLGERMITIDCDVQQADGGTRTAAITGGFVALAQALAYLRDREPNFKIPMTSMISAVSVGMVNGEPLLDLCYLEDSSAETDVNFVMNHDNAFVEIQGTAEEKPFTAEHLTKMSLLAQKGCAELFKIQKKCLNSMGIEIG